MPNLRKTTFCAALLALVTGCETSDRFDACVADNTRVIVCRSVGNGDRTSSSIVSGKRHEYPDAADGICKGEWGSRAFEIGHDVVLVYGATPLVWSICGLESHLEPVPAAAENVSDVP